MKKYLFLLVYLAMTGVLRAQHCDSIFNYRLDGYSFHPYFTIQLGDHSIVNLARQDTITPNNQVKQCYLVFNKISRHGATILNSVLIENPKSIGPILMARLHDNGNPYYEQYCNTFVSVVTDEDSCKTDLNIAFFNDDIVFNDDMAITVPLEDTIIDYYMLVCECFLDSNNDIVFQYSIPTRQDVVFVRFGIDGVLKQKTIYPRSLMQINNHTVIHGGWIVQGFKQSCKAPVKYLIYGTDEPTAYVSQSDFIWYEFDSSFNILKTGAILSSNPNAYPFIHNVRRYNGMVELEDGNYLVTRKIQWDSDFEAAGITKYDENCNELYTVWFDAVEVFNHPSGYHWDSFDGIGLEKDDNGNVFCAYKCIIDSTYYLTIVKLDEDLNVVWQYYGFPNHMPISYSIASTSGIKVLDEGGAVVFAEHRGNDCLYSGGLCMLVVDDDGVGVAEMNVALRPYLCYPNPVTDRLNIKYSPDATPKTVELYDLQGRLIGTQTSDFESIDMKQLPAGTYTMRVVLDNGKAYSDRIIKQ